MTIPSSLRAWCVAGTIVLTAVVVSRGALNGFEPVKLMMVATGAAASLAALWLSGGVTDKLMQRRVPLVAAGIVLVVMAVAAVVVSASPAASLIGARTRWGGLLLYASCGGLLVVAATLQRQGIRWVLGGIAVAGGLVSAVGLLQWLGVPILEGIGSQIGAPSTLGNINFAAGYVGASAGAMAWMALEPAFDKVVRGFGAFLLLLAVGYILASSSFQGVPTLGAAVLVVVMHRAWSYGGAWRRVGVPAIALVTLVTAGVVAAGVLGVGPVSVLGAETGVQLRRGYWGAAVGMVADNPVLGVGPEQYVYDFRTQRSYQAADFPTAPSGDQAFDQSALLENDAAHNIFLHHAASGGLLLLAAFIGLLVTVIIAAVGGYRRPGVDTTLLSGAAGVLAGYVTQGLVSIDVSALATLGWVAMGLVVAASATAVVPPTGKGRTSKRTKPKTPRRVTADWRKVTAAGLVVVAVAVLSGQPLRAESRAAGVLLQGSTVEQRSQSARQTADIGFWDPRYEETLGFSLLASGDLSGVEVVDRLYDDGVLTGSGAIQMARRLTELEPTAAAGWYDRALTLDPKHPELRLEAAQFFAGQGQTERARTLVADLLQDDPDNAAAMALSAEL